MKPKNIIVSLATFLASVGILFAATTIGTNISTGGNLQVDGNATTTGNLVVSGLASTTNLTTVTATTTGRVVIGDDTTNYDNLGLSISKTWNLSGFSAYGIFSNIVNSDDVSNLYGTYSFARKSNGTLTGDVYGGYFQGSGSGPGFSTKASNVYGIYATAGFGTHSYAGYFDGADVVVTNHLGIGTTTPTTELQVTTSSSDATSTLTLGKTAQNKGSCLELFTSDGTAIYAYVPAGANAFTLSSVSCK
jgi:hypothetical protein